jgi:hypothetical protein
MAASRITIRSSLPSSDSLSEIRGNALEQRAGNYQAGLVRR